MFKRMSAAWHSCVAAHWSKYHCYKYRGKKILKCSLALFFTCPVAFYFSILIEILLVPGSRTSDFFNPEVGTVAICQMLK